jgi:hypothetical protein
MRTISVGTSPLVVLRVTAVDYLCEALNTLLEGIR